MAQSENTELRTIFERSYALTSTATLSDFLTRETHPTILKDQPVVCTSDVNQRCLTHPLYRANQFPHVLVATEESADGIAISFWRVSPNVLQWDHSFTLGPDLPLAAPNYTVSIGQRSGNSAKEPGMTDVLDTLRISSEFQRVTYETRSQHGLWEVGEGMSAFTSQHASQELWYHEECLKECPVDVDLHNTKD